MIRRIVRAILGLMLRIFYRRIEVLGLEKVPPAPRPAIFVLNHPNALVDPLFILRLAPRRVSFLAKSTIFRMPVIAFIARALESLPVYRAQDQGEDPRRNRETFAAARALLSRGGTIAIFPEGTSHSEPALRPLKSGAARIALSARAGLDGLDIVPVGLYYTEKMTFRSKALASFGDPIAVPSVALDEGDEPPREPVRDLSARIEEALRAVTLNADATAALETIARAERIFSADLDPDRAPRTVARELTLRRRFVEAYAALLERDPGALTALERRLRAYEDILAAAGLEPENVRARWPARAVVRFVLVRLVLLPVLLPLAVAGLVTHWPAYRLIGWIAGRFEDDDMTATVKMLGALLFFPLTWGALATAAGLASGGFAALVTLAAAPAAGYAALRWGENLARSLAATRALYAFVGRPRFTRLLIEERRAIRAEMERLGSLAHAKISA